MLILAFTLLLISIIYLGQGFKGEMDHRVLCAHFCHVIIVLKKVSNLNWDFVYVEKIAKS